MIQRLNSFLSFNLNFAITDCLFSFFIKLFDYSIFFSISVQTCSFYPHKPRVKDLEQQHFRLSLLSCFGYSRFFYNSHTADTSLPPALRLAHCKIQTRTKLYNAEVVNEHRQSLSFLTDIISRVLFIFRRPPLEGFLCGAYSNG